MCVDVLDLLVQREFQGKYSTLALSCPACPTVRRGRGGGGGGEREREREREREKIKIR